MSAAVAVAFIVREKFGWALASLRRIYRCFDADFTLYFVDCGYPQAVRRDIDAFLADKNNVVRIDSPRYLLPNESLNLVVERLAEPYLCSIQNDVLIEPGFASALLSTFEQGADIVQPETSELQGGTRRPHRDQFTDTQIVPIDGYLRLQVVVPGLERGALPAVRRVHHFEMHTLAMTARAARLVAPLPAINSREHIDLAVSAYKKELSAYVNENAGASYVLPPIRDYDVDYFRFRWDIERARQSHELVRQRWGLFSIPSAMGFVTAHNGFLAPEKVLRDRPQPSEADIF